MHGSLEEYDRSGRNNHMINIKKATDHDAPRKTKFVLGVLWFYFLFFSVPLPYIGISSVYLMNVAGIASLLVVEPGRFASFIMRKTFLFPLLILFLFLSFSVAWPIAHNTNDFTLVLISVGQINLYIGSAIFAYVSLKNYDETLFVKTIFYAIILQAMVVMAMLFVPLVREIIFDVFTEGRRVFDRSSGFRGLGLSGELVYGLSIGVAFGMMFAMYLYYSGRVKLIYIIGLFLLFFTVTLLARTGFLVMPFLLFFIVYSMFKTSRTLSLSSIQKTVVLFVFSIMALVLFVAWLNYSDGPLSSFVKGWSFELINNFMEAGEIRTDSTDVMLGMYFVPSLQSLLYGDGLMANPDGSYYMHTDIGYLRHVLFFGVVPALFLYGFFYSIAHVTIAKMDDNLLKASFLSFVIISFVAHAKGLFLHSSFFLVLLFVFYFYFKAGRAKKTRARS